MTCQSRTEEVHVCVCLGECVCVRVCGAWTEESFLSPGSDRTGLDWEYGVNP